MSSSEDADQRDARGRALVLPAGTGDGDHITLLLDGCAAVLTVSVR